MTWVIARDRKLGMVLLGGVGFQGVGEYWREDREYMAEKEGYHDAPEQDSRGGFGSPYPANYEATKSS